MLNRFSQVVPGGPVLFMSKTENYSERPLVFARMKTFDLTIAGAKFGSVRSRLFLCISAESGLTQRV
jgi:hypothetical protein